MSARIFCEEHYAYKGDSNMPDPECITCGYIRKAVQHGAAMLTPLHGLDGPGRVKVGMGS